MYNQHIILDFEMNPISKENKCIRRILPSEIIEIGAVKLNERFEIADKFGCLIKPQYNKEIKPQIVRLTGITSLDISMSASFEKALPAFRNWIGKGKTRIYSWGKQDIIQLKRECRTKDVMFPPNMQRWIDFQPVYMRLMKLGKAPTISLDHASQLCGIDMDKGKAHRALYDAEITATLVQSALTGEYKKQVSALEKNMNRYEELTVSIGNVCGDVLKKILNQLTEPASSLNIDYSK